MKSFSSWVFGLALTLLTAGAANATVVATSTNSDTVFSSSFSDTITVVPNETISTLTISINWDHTWVSDLEPVTLTHVGTGTVINLTSFTGFPGSNVGTDPGNNDNLSPAWYTFGDAGATDLGTAAGLIGNSDEINPSVIYLAGNSESFAALFGGESTMGDWTLSITDNFQGGDPGHIAANGWSITFNPTVVPVPAALPLFLSALVALGLVGRRRQSAAAAA